MSIFADLDEQFAARECNGGLYTHWRISNEGFCASAHIELSDTVLDLYIQCMYMSTKRVNFRLPEELVTHADIAAEVTHKNRTEILIEALRQYLDEMESEESFREAVVELYLDDQIEFDTLADVIGRQNAESVRASKQVLDRGEELADKLADL